MAAQISQPFFCFGASLMSPSVPDPRGAASNHSSVIVSRPPGKHNKKISAGERKSFAFALCNQTVIAFLAKRTYNEPDAAGEGAADEENFYGDKDKNGIRTAENPGKNKKE
ncbi:MAG: hypothetical protein LUD69_04100 [Oscillospiraceae bacterium]|nr:hypothetical protein [Oscillospiraceae bacterium]